MALFTADFFHVGDSKSYNQIKNFINTKKLSSYELCLL